MKKKAKGLWERSRKLLLLSLVLLLLFCLPASAMETAPLEPDSILSHSQIVEFQEDLFRLEQEFQLLERNLGRDFRF